MGLQTIHRMMIMFYLCLPVGVFPWQPCGGDKGSSEGVVYDNLDSWLTGGGEGGEEGWRQ